MGSCATLFEGEVAMVTFSWLSRGDGELSALTRSGLGDGCFSHPSCLFLLPQGSVSSLQGPCTWPSPR